MLSVKEARKLGIAACIDKIGRDFCKKHADNAVSGYSKFDDRVECFVGVSDEPAEEIDIATVKKLVLSEQNDWKYSAECSVSRMDGKITFI